MSKSITITSARNKSLIGKKGTIDGNTILVGRTLYNLTFARFQPNKAAGDFSIEMATLEDHEGLFIDRNGLSGTRIHRYTIND